MTDNDRRPKADAILSQITYEEEKKEKGHLKIFLGMAAGVGKTYAMLKAAIELQKAGNEIVVGLVEDHGRKETAELTHNFEILQRRTINYQGVNLLEFDLERALKRNPQIILVDELAHTNVPGTKHAKRYLDIIDLLNAGIDVYTTVNIQHLESRSDTVQEITGVTIHETVPDSFFDLADEIILIDLSAEELLKRLSEGKIYPKDRIALAEANFFRKGNLTALREMALRHAAERVDRDLRDFKQLHGIGEAWKSSHRLMVTIFASTQSEALIRWTRRIADMMGATWIGAYIEKNEPLSDEELGLLATNMALVKELGGEVMTTKEDDVVNGILYLARQNDVTQIIVGKSNKGFFSSLFFGSIMNKLIQKSGDIDVYCVSPQPESQAGFIEKKARPFMRDFFPFEEMGWLTFFLIITLAFASAIEPIIGYHAVGIIFLVLVCISGLFLSRVSVLILATIYSMVHNFFYIPPFFSVRIYRPEDAILLVTFFIAAAVIGHLTSRLRLKEKILQERENINLRQYELSRKLATAQSVDEVAEVGLSQMKRVMKQDVCMFLADQKLHKLQLFLQSSFGFSAKEKAVAEWVWQNSRPAGRFTDTLSGSKGFYLPIIGKSHCLGVIGIKIAKRGELNFDELSFIESVANQLANSLERESYHEEARGERNG